MRIYICTRVMYMRVYIYIYIPKQSGLIYLGTLATTENPKQSGLGYLGYLGGEMQFGKLEN